MENARHRLLVAHDENMADLLVRNDCLKRAEVDVVLRELYFAYTTPFFRRGPSVELGRGQAEALHCLQASRRGGFVRSVGGDDGRVRVLGHAAFAFSGSVPCGNSDRRCDT